MYKKILIVVGAFILLIAIVEIVSLLRVGWSVAKYAQYWKDYPKDGEFTYVVLGDSAAQGVGASSPENSYPYLLAKRIEAKTGKKVRIVNLSVSGAVIEDVTTKQVPQISQYKPDLITVEVGGNDVVRTEQKLFKEKYSALVAALPTDAFVATVPYFGGRIRKNDRAIQLSEVIKSEADRKQLPVIDLQTYTRNHNSIFNYSSDLFHPSNRGYKGWTDAFWEVIEPTL